MKVVHFILKVSNVTIALAAVAIVAVLAASLIVGLGVVQGRKTTVVSTAYNTETLYQTLTQPITQTIVSTVSNGSNAQVSTGAVSTTITSISTSRIVETIATTRNITETHNQTVPMTITFTRTASQSSGIVTILQTGSIIEFAVGQRIADVPQATTYFGFSGFLDITWQGPSSDAVQWILTGNNINETSLSMPTGGVEFPIQAGIGYSLIVVNNGCTQFSCNNSFNVTASIFYEY
jgi:hypothetical protein